MKIRHNPLLASLFCVALLSCGCNKSAQNTTGTTPPPGLPPVSAEQQKQDAEQAQKALAALQAVPAVQRRTYVHDHFMEVGSIMRSQDPKVQSQFKQLMDEANK